MLAMKQKQPLSVFLVKSQGDESFRTKFMAIQSNLPL